MAGPGLCVLFAAACHAPTVGEPATEAATGVPVAVELPLPAALAAASAARASAGAAARTQDPEAPAEPAEGPTRGGQDGERTLGPEILVPVAADDAIVATVGPHTLRKSHVFDRLATSNPRLATDVIDLLVLDLLVAGHAQEHDIETDAAAVEELVNREVELLGEGVAGQFEGVALETYVRANFRMDLESFRELVRLRIAQRVYHDTVVRFMALREDRVRVRYIVHRDAALVAEIARKVEEGADFGSLALQHSEDGSRRDNGLLPPFGPGFDHPIAAAAFALEAGEVSPVFTVEGQEGPRHYLVYCLERIPGQPDVVYADVAESIRRGLSESPCSDFETRAYILRHSDRLDRLGGVELAPRSVLDGAATNR